MAPPPFDRNDAAGDQPASCCEVPEHCPLQSSGNALARTAPAHPHVCRRVEAFARSRRGERNARLGARCAAELGTFPVWRFQRTPPLMPGLRADFAPCSRPQPPAAAHCLLKLARGVIAASAPEQREQDDDRKGNSEYPQQQAATEAHHVLLWFVDSREPPQTAPGLSPSAQAGRSRMMIGIGIPNSQSRIGMFVLRS